MRRRWIAVAALLFLAALAGLTFAAPVAGNGATYYVNRNAQKSGDHEVHTTACKKGAQEHNRVYLGRFTSCEDAVREAKKLYRRADGCHWCSPACDHG